MRLMMETGRDRNVRDSGQLAKLLDTLDSETNTFAILEKSDDTYLQVAARDEGFIIERRDGSHRAHSYACHLGFQRPVLAEHKWWKVWRSDVGQDRFSLEEVKRVFEDYLLSRSNSSNIEWVRMPMQKAPASAELVLNAITYVIGAIFVGFVALILVWERL